MLTTEQNDLLTRTGPGTPGGEYMRRYWLPAVLAEELPEPDCPPIRVKLLGEELVAFRDSNGRIGLLDEFCAHRRASLWLGRNEECGLRCVYHGWKYDVDGNCVDMMNEPEELQFTSKVHLKSYPAVELGGLIWAYMGATDKMPPLPKFEWTQMPDTHRHVSKTWEECNWLQALEGGLDTSHAPIMHRRLRPEVARGGISPTSYFARGKAPIVEVDTTDYGYTYAGIRELAREDSMLVRAYHYVMPFTQIRPSQFVGDDQYKPMVAGHYWVPMDDENCMVYNWRYVYGSHPLTQEQRYDDAAGPENTYIDRGYRKKRNRDNAWLIDRQVQRTETFTGIAGVNTQDHAVQESMGPIVDRSQEHLGPADKAIIALRQLLLRGVKTVQEGGDPPGLGQTYYWLRAIERVLPVGADWRAELSDELYEQAAAQLTPTACRS
ncbi:MAG TPA: Rieske 2Fe-2S domain-containing protein [Chloroflexota bacterium]|nr:Rieske 2Fe-2S domain-containing protein [Chloroflexota bacterium]